MKAFLLMLAAFSLVSVQAIIIIPPSQPETQGLPDTALIFLTPESISENAYHSPLLHLANKTTEIRLWIAIASAHISPDMSQLAITASVELLVKSGLKIQADNSTQFWLGGHSTAADSLQEFKSLPPAFKPAGLVLLSSYLKPNNYQPLDSLPVLTIGGDLDGLVRVTKLAESNYFDSGLNKMTFIIEGMNHFQFPGLVHTNDFKAEISNSAAVDKVTSLMAAFITTSVVKTSDQAAFLRSNAALTRAFTAPIIAALELEGSTRIRPICEKNTTSGGECTRGSEWSSTAMGGAGVEMSVADDWLDTAAVEFASIHNNCSGSVAAGCVLNVTTMSALVYGEGEAGPSGATEIRTKLMSRQALLLAFTGVKYDFNVSGSLDCVKGLNDCK